MIYSTGREEVCVCVWVGVYAWLGVLGCGVRACLWGVVCVCVWLCVVYIGVHAFNVGKCFTVLSFTSC